MSFDWAAHFPILQETMNGKRLAYLDSAATALKPTAVVSAMEHYLARTTSNVHRGIYRLSEENTQAFERVRDQLKVFLNARAREEVIFTKGTTEGINLVAQSWGRQQLRPGDEIVLTMLEHHSNIIPWQLVAAETGAVIKVIALDREGQLDLASARQQITARTKLLAFTLTSNTLGVITPARDLMALARAVSATVLVDAAQWAPHYPIDVQSLDCDFLVFSGHKTFGPNAVGVLYGKQALLKAMPPWQGGGNMISTVSFEGSSWNVLPEKFEAGTPAIAEVLGLGAALEFMAQVGFEELHQRVVALKNEAQEKLLALPGVAVLAARAPRVATFGFEVQGIHPQDLGSVLDKEGVAIRTGHHCTQPLLKHFGKTALARASFGPYNTSQDIDQLVAAIQKAQRLFL